MTKTCKHCGKSEPEIVIPPIRKYHKQPICVECGAKRKVRCDTPIIGPRVAGYLEAITDWRGVSDVATDCGSTSVAIRSAMYRLETYGFVEARMSPERMERRTQGGYFEYRRTKLATAWLDARPKPKPVAEPVKTEPRRTGNPWFDLGLEEHV